MTHWWPVKMLVLFCLLAFSVQPALAQAGENEHIQLTAQVGYGGYCKNGHPFPVRVTVENQGPGLEGQVQLVYGGMGNQTRYTVPVSLPTTSRKEFFLYAYPVSGLPGMSLVLLVDGKVIKEIKPRIMCLNDKTNWLVGVLSGNSNASIFINSRVMKLERLVKAVDLKPADLPDNPEAWMSLDALFVSGVDLGGLSDAQRLALNEWLARGGVLLVIGGANWQGPVAGLSEILPVNVQGAQAVEDLSGLQSFVKAAEPPVGPALLAAGPLRPGAESLVDGVLARKNIGFGVVYYLGVDPELAPLNDWAGWPQVYEALLATSPARPVWIAGPYDGIQMNRALSALAEMLPPDTAFMLGWLLIYLVCIGPLNYLVLRMLKRLEWAWLSVPLISLVFTGVAYGTGFQFRGVSPVLNRIAIVQAWDTQPQAQVYGLVGVYSPVRQAVNLHASKGFFPAPYSGDTFSNEAIHVTLDGDEAIVSAIDVEIGGMKTFSAQGSVPALPIQHDLVLQISDGRPQLEGTVTNQSGQTLRDAYLVSPAGERRLGDLAPGQSKAVSFSFLQTSRVGSFYSFDSLSMLDVSYEDLDSDVSVARRSALLNAFRSNTYTYTPNPNWGVYLTGWLDEPVLPITLKDAQSRFVDTTFYAVALTPAFEFSEGEIFLHPALYTWVSTSPESFNPFSSNAISPDHVLRYRLAFAPPRAKIKSLTLHLKISPSTQSQVEILAHLWNFEKRQWETVAGDYDGSLVIPNPQAYVGPLGEIRIHLSGNNQSFWDPIESAYFSVVMQP